MKKNIAVVTSPAVNRRVNVTLDKQSQEMFNAQSFGREFVSFKAIVATTANLMKSGGLVIPTDRIRIEDDVCNVTLVLTDLELVFRAAREYEANRTHAVEDVRVAIGAAESTIEFAKANNDGLCLSTQEEELNSLRAQLKKLAFGTPTESAIRSTMDEAYTLVMMVKNITVDFLKAKAAAVSQETGCEEELAQVLADLPKNPDNARKSLVEFIRSARATQPIHRGGGFAKPAAHTTAAPLRERIGTSLGRIGR